MFLKNDLYRFPPGSKVIATHLQDALVSFLENSLAFDVLSKSLIDAYRLTSKGYQAFRHGCDLIYQCSVTLPQLVTSPIQEAVPVTAQSIPGKISDFLPRALPQPRGASSRIGCLGCFSSAVIAPDVHFTTFFNSPEGYRLWCHRPIETSFSLYTHANARLIPRGLL